MRINPRREEKRQKKKRPGRWLLKGVHRTSSIILTNFIRILFAEYGAEVWGIGAKKRKKERTARVKKSLNASVRERVHVRSAGALVRVERSRIRPLEFISK